MIMYRFGMRVINALETMTGFILRSSIQKMWNEIAMEKAEAAKSKTVEETAENVSDSDMSKRCQPAAENADERQQDLDQSEQDLLPEISNLAPDAWPDDLKDIPVPTLENILRYLKKEEKRPGRNKVCGSRRIRIPS